MGKKRKEIPKFANEAEEREFRPGVLLTLLTLIEPA